jgi:radical SAM protein with 4Fe4S-binding SPASM domain
MVLGDVPLAHAGMASDIELQKQYYDEGKVFIVQIESTIACLQSCLYCYRGSKPDSPHGLSSEKIIELLQSAAGMGVRMIDWLGGDPLLRWDWEDLCNKATELGMINNIWTSGIPLSDPDVAKRAVAATPGGFISVHLDTLDPELYMCLHESASYSSNVENILTILKGVKNCLKAGKDPGAMVNSIAFTKPLAGNDTNATILYFQEKFGIKTCLTLFNPVINNNSSSDWEPKSAQIKAGFAFRDRINYPDQPSCGSMDVSKYYCGTVVCVSAEGWLLPCSVIRTEEFGNVNDDTLENLVASGTEHGLLYLDFRDESKLPGNCASCTNNCNCFGCRSSAFYYNGDMLAADPKCYQLNPKEGKTAQECTQADDENA